MNNGVLKKNVSKVFLQTNTIDEKHTEMLNQFHDIETTKVPSLIKERDYLKDVLKTLDETQIENLMDIKDNIKNINLQIRFLKIQKKKYLLDNSKYIFQYFEDKKKISSGDNNKNVNKLNFFFKINHHITKKIGKLSQPVLAPLVADK
jgi:hypothetical protein